MEEDVGFRFLDSPVNRGPIADIAAAVVKLQLERREMTGIGRHIVGKADDVRAEAGQPKG